MKNDDDDDDDIWKFMRMKELYYSNIKRFEISNGCLLLTKNCKTIVFSM